MWKGQRNFQAKGKACNKDPEERNSYIWEMSSSSMCWNEMVKERAPQEKAVMNKIDHLGLCKQGEEFKFYFIFFYWVEF